MSKTLDVRGLSCPQPVILTKKALDGVEALTVVVDDPAAKENVRRLAEEEGYTVTIEEKGDGTYLHLEKTAGCALASAGKAVTGPAVLVLVCDRMGRGEDELGGILMRAFLHTLTEATDRPEKIILFNTGVKLAVEGSEGLEDLKILEKNGVEILVCGTCLGYFNLKDKLATGQVSNMYSITEILFSAGRLVTV